jgi:hypothetical protein
MATATSKNNPAGRAPKNQPKKVKVSEERKLMLEIVETASMAGAQLLLNKLRKKFGS